MPSSAITPRTRDPQRRQRITAAATELIAERGYHQVSMADIGRRAGITGSGIYRYFDSKALILVELLEQTIDGLADGLEQTLATVDDPQRALDQLIAGQVRFAVEGRAIARVYYEEIRNLPADDQRRLRRKQRRYIERWAQLLRTARPELDEDAAITVVHAAIGAVHSPRLYAPKLAPEVLTRHLNTAAHAVLGSPPGGSKY